MQHISVTCAPLSVTCAPHFSYMCTTFQLHMQHISVTYAPHFSYLCTTFQLHMHHISVTCATQFHLLYTGGILLFMVSPFTPYFPHSQSEHVFMKSYLLFCSYKYGNDANFDGCKHPAVLFCTLPNESSSHTHTHKHTHTHTHN